MIKPIFALENPLVEEPQAPARQDGRMEKKGPQNICRGKRRAG